MNLAGGLIKIKLTSGRAVIGLINEIPAKEAVTADGPLELNVQRAKW
jgi:hypothetical protein